MSSPNPASNSHATSPAPAPSSHQLAVPPIPASSISVSQRVLDTALDSLSPAQRKTLQEHGAGGTSDVRAAVDETYIAASDKKRQCDDKQWRWQFRGEDVVLRDVAEKVILWVDRFKSVGDVAANASPVYAGLPWVGIRMVLEVTQKQRSGSSTCPHILIVRRCRCLNIAKWPRCSLAWTFR